VSSRTWIAWLSLAFILLVSSAIGADTVGVETLYEFMGPTESMAVPSSVDFPDYGDRRYWNRTGTYRLAHEAPYGGSFGVVYQRQTALIVEVLLRFHIDYLHAIIYYPDGRTPRFFQKQNLHVEGLGLAFRERPIDPAWDPERLLPGFRGAGCTHGALRGERWLQGRREGHQ
jgi:hypothetical protein